jgi:hypothetical protein
VLDLDLGFNETRGKDGQTFETHVSTKAGLQVANDVLPVYPLNVVSGISSVHEPCATGAFTR